MSLFWLRAAAVLYAAGLLQAILTILRRRSSWFVPALGTFSVGAVLHLVSLVETGFAGRRLPAGNFYETLSLCAFLIALLFLFIYWRYKFEGLGVFLFPLVFVMTLVGGLRAPVGHWSTTTARDAWLLLHVVTVLLGYAALLLTAVASIFYIVQERHLKRKRPGFLTDRLPPLGTLDNLISRSMAFGFVLITLGVITGSTWAYIESGTRWLGDPKIAVSFATWVFCLLMVFFRVTAGWRGRKAAVMAIAVVGSSAVTWAAHVGLRSLIAP